MKVAIIGGGLAGTSCAYALSNQGIETVIYEAASELASGASGNSRGLYNPRFSAHRDPKSDYYTAAFSLAVRTFSKLKDIDYNPCGALHLIVNEKQKQRFPQTLKNWGWDSDHMRLLNAEQASDVAGIELAQDALYIPEGGSISPKKLCHTYAKNIRLYPGRRIKDLSEIDADIKILACGSAIRDFPETSWLPVYPIRGQVTTVKTTPLSAQLQCNLCYGGYISSAQNGEHIIGATFQRWLDHHGTLPQDDQDNLEKLRQHCPALAQGLEVTGQRASVRTASKDYFPIVGAIPGQKNIYVSAGHGSHGILSTLVAAHLLGDMITGRPKCFPDATIRHLSPERFLSQKTSPLLKQEGAG